MNEIPIFRAAIFDFDGVLVDSIPLHHASYRDLFAAEGVEFGFDDYIRVANGAPRDRVIRSILGEDLPQDRFQWLMNRKEEIILEMVKDNGLPFIEGVLNLVDKLKAMELRIGIASSSRSAEKFIRALNMEQLFDAVTDAVHTTHTKPDPEVYLATASRLGVQPQDCIVFEDAPVGITAARAAEMKVVAITTTNSAEELRDADWVIDSFTGFDLLSTLFLEVVTEP